MLGSGCKFSLNVCRAPVSARQVPRARPQGEGPSLGRQLRGITHNDKECVGNFGADPKGTEQGWGDASNRAAMCRDVPCRKGVLEAVSRPSLIPLKPVFWGSAYRQRVKAADNALVRQDLLCRAERAFAGGKEGCRGGRRCAVLWGHCIRQEGVGAV